MTTIAILPVPSPEGPVTYYAVAGRLQSAGQTAGEALDAIARQLSSDEAGTLVIVQNQRSDQFFSDEQQRRLGNLMNHWRQARDSGSTLSEGDQQQLEELIETELRAAGRRASAMANELES